MAGMKISPNASNSTSFLQLIANVFTQRVGIKMQTDVKTTDGRSDEDKYNKKITKNEGEKQTRTSNRLGEIDGEVMVSRMYEDAPNEDASNEYASNENVSNEDASNEETCNEDASTEDASNEGASNENTYYKDASKEDPSNNDTARRDR